MSIILSLPPLVTWVRIFRLPFFKRFLIVVFLFFQTNVKIMRFMLWISSGAYDGLYQVYELGCKNFFLQFYLTSYPQCRVRWCHSGIERRVFLFVLLILGSGVLLCCFCLCRGTLLPSFCVRPQAGYVCELMNFVTATSRSSLSLRHSVVSSANYRTFMIACSGVGGAAFLARTCILPPTPPPFKKKQTFAFYRWDFHC